MTLTLPAAPGLPDSLEPLLQQSAALHGHLCPRQILGVRMGLLAGQVLGLPFPRSDKRVMVLIETDGCFADGVSVASGCWLGRRTLRLLDYGRVAATFVDVKTRQAVRLAPQVDLRQRVRDARAHGERRWDAYHAAYRTLPDEALFSVTPAELTLDLTALISLPGKRVICEACQEEVINGRELSEQGRVLCRACAGDAAYLG
ncbi:hypothetical protein DEIPH_ctg046orf0017 [Deinococcus phoenicis]|uniref:Formylmethanofuran dehydrogenase subunit E domain-containing protein n=1 Tax=Deinococcus phoenicis TaxID=1476583 RepID=A0A016QMK5_9DEIO|nr:FmdE family protein [Deinococcus phoenicis]EYB67226.1 hypothetical protein DEIPH_ctg046orf0017 [Deinococcus phoenicis]